MPCSVRRQVSKVRPVQDAGKAQDIFWSGATPVQHHHGGVGVFQVDTGL